MFMKIDELISGIGLPATLRLVEAYGGTRLYLPSIDKLNSEHPIVLTIGLDAARKLAGIWPMDRGYVPLVREHLRAVRNRELRQDNEVMSVSALARKYKLSERQVYEILAAPEPAQRKEEKQAGLF